MLCWSFGFVNRIQNFFSSEPIYWLYATHGFLVSLQGFFNSLIYGLNDEIKDCYRKLFSRIWHKCCTNRILSIQEDSSTKHIYGAIKEYDESLLDNDK